MLYYNLGNTKLFLYNENESIENADSLEKIFNEVMSDYTKAINLGDKEDCRYYSI